MASKKMGVVAVLSCLFLVACAGQSHSGGTTVANSNEASGSHSETTVNGNEVAMSGSQMSDESMLEDSFSDSE